MTVHHNNTPPLFVFFAGPLITALLGLGRETVARLLAYVGADYLLARIIKRESPKVRQVVDDLFDD